MKNELSRMKGHLMSGISFVLPLIIGASLVVALGWQVMYYLLNIFIYQQLL